MSQQMLPTLKLFTFLGLLFGVWLRSSVVSVLISLISDIGTCCRLYINLKFSPGDGWECSHSHLPTHAPGLAH